MNALTRLEHGPASSRSPARVERCLKLFLSDGYSCNDDKRTHFIGIEVSPIKDLSVNSKPGIKLLLKGEIRIRLGVIMLHEGNTLVLGGSVPSLLEVQKKALKAARRVAGVGVDHTIRALIWNPFTGTEEDQDEHDVASTHKTMIPSGINNNSSVSRSNPYCPVNELSKVVDVSIMSSNKQKNGEENKSEISSDFNSIDEQHQFFLQANIQSEPSLPSHKFTANKSAKESRPIIDLCDSPVIIADLSIPAKGHTSHILSEKGKINSIDEKKSFRQTELSMPLIEKETNPSLLRSLSLTSSLIIPVSFQELVTLLNEHILKDPKVYESYEERVFVSPSKMVENKKIQFNIGKKKRGASKVPHEKDDKVT